jgi:hypothetical protein
MLNNSYKLMKINSKRYSSIALLGVVVAFLRLKIERSSTNSWSQRTPQCQFLKEVQNQLIRKQSLISNLILIITNGSFGKLSHGYHHEEFNSHNF